MHALTVVAEGKENRGGGRAIRPNAIEREKLRLADADAGSIERRAALFDSPVRELASPWLNRIAQRKRAMAEPHEARDEAQRTSAKIRAERPLKLCSMLYTRFATGGAADNNFEE